MEQTALKARLRGGAMDETLSRLYTPRHLAEERERCARLLDTFAEAFGREAEALFSAPGRTELGGNHTDHQQGRVLAAAVDLDLLAAAAPNEIGLLRVRSGNYPMMIVDLTALAPRPGEEGTSVALIRGVAAGLVRRGCKLEGADICLTSRVPSGSGLSSSAAFEVLMGTVLNGLFAGGRTPLELAQIGQYAENEFFGKPCGLMDQTASSLGGVVAMDFADPDRPEVEQIPLDLSACGSALCILDSGADHADLTAEYAAITGELKLVCRYFGQEVLRQVPEEEFQAALPQLRRRVGDRAVLRAIHVYEENRRAKGEADALKAGDFDGFLELVRQSGRSSALYLQNVVPAGQSAHQELLFTLALCEGILGGRGAVRVHGGGFGGTAQAFVPLDLLDRFQRRTEEVLGPGRCHVVTIRPAGGVRLE